MRPVRLLLGLSALLGAALLISWLLGEDGAPTRDPTLEADTPHATDAADPTPRTAPGLTGSTATLDATPEGDTAAKRAAARRITGEVLDESGRGIAGAQVRVAPVDPDGLRGAPYADLAIAASTTSERDGQFTLEQAPTGRWLRITAAHAGHATVGRLVASAGAHVILVLPPAGGLRLTIVDTEDHPVADAQVFAATGETRRVRASDAKGRVHFDALPPGAVTVRLVMASHGSARAGPYLIRPGETVEHVVVVPRRVRVEGVVLDKLTGDPVGAAFVRLARPGQAETATTDAKGYFGPLDGGGAGERILLAVDAPGYAAALVPVVLRGPGLQSAVVRLTAAEPWSGRVVDAGGRPVAGATVRYTADGVATPGRLATTKSDAEGRFTLGPPPQPAPGRRVVLVAETPSALAALALHPRQGQPAGLVLTLLGGARVTGVVRSAEGDPLARVGVRLTPAWSEMPRAPAAGAAMSRLHALNASTFQGLAGATDTAGQWHVDHVPAGAYRVHFAHAQGTHEREELLVVESTTTTAGTETLQPGIELTGTVVDARGAGIPGVRVTVAQDRRRRTQATTDTRGSFVLRGLSAGQHTIATAIPGRPAVRQLVTLVAGEANDIRLQLDEPALVRLQVLRGGAPYRGLLTVVFGESGSGRRTTRRHTLRIAGGTAVIQDAPTGAWTVEAFAPGGLRAQTTNVEVDAGRETPVLLELGTGARLTGTVRTTTGAPVGGAGLDLTHPATGGKLHASADAQGRYRFDSLAAGDWTLRVEGHGGAERIEQIVLGSGEARSLDPTLAPAGTLRVLVVDSRGRPVADAAIRFRHQEQDRIVRRAPRTDAHGVVVQPDLPVGALLVVARTSKGSGLAKAEIRVGETTEVRLVLVERRVPEGPK